MKKKLRPFFYGVAELGPASIDIFLKVYLLLFFNVILGLSPMLTSLAIGLGVLWDAIMDPWIGVYSDRYFHRKRDRKKILYVAVFICVFLFFVLWRIPPASTWITFTILFAISSMLNSAISLFAVPYIAVANDLEPDNEKRKIWTGWRMAFFNIGSFVGLAVPAYFLTAAGNPNSPEPYQYASTALCVVMLFLSLGSMWYVYSFNIPNPNQEVQNRTEVSLLTLARDKEFLRLMISFFVVNCGLGLNSALALYYYKYHLMFTEAQTQGILVGFLIVFTLSIPFWVVMTRYFNKKILIFNGCFALGVLTCIAFPNFSGVPYEIVLLIASGLGGVLVGVAVVLEILLSDFLNHKETETLQNVSGQYLGIWKMAAKVSRAVAIAAAGPIIQAAKEPGVLANYFGWGVGIFFILGALVIYMPIKGAPTGAGAR